MEPHSLRNKKQNKWWEIKKKTLFKHMFKYVWCPVLTEKNICFFCWNRASDNSLSLEWVMSAASWSWQGCFSVLALHSRLTNVAGKATCCGSQLWAKWFLQWQIAMRSLGHVLLFSHTLLSQILLRFVKICSIPCLRVTVLHRNRKTGVLSRPFCSPQIHNNVRAPGTLWLVSTLCSQFNYKNKSMHVYLYKYISLSLWCT